MVLFRRQRRGPRRSTHAHVLSIIEKTHNLIDKIISWAKGICVCKLDSLLEGGDNVGAVGRGAIVQGHVVLLGKGKLFACHF